MAWKLTKGNVHLHDTATCVTSTCISSGRCWNTPDLEPCDLYVFSTVTKNPAKWGYHSSEEVHSVKQGLCHAGQEFFEINTQKLVSWHE